MTKSSSLQKEFLEICWPFLNKCLSVFPLLTPSLVFHKMLDFMGHYIVFVYMYISIYIIHTHRLLLYRLLLKPT